MSLLNALLVAVDGGPRDALQPIAAACAVELASAYPGHAGEPAYWSRQIACDSPSLLVTGTSDSVEGRRIERAARSAARGAELPVAVVEDFPGNCPAELGDGAALLVVESAAAREIALARLGARCPRMEIVAAARYDRYRMRSAQLRESVSSRWAGEDTQAPRILWAGQPETDDALLTLGVVLQALRAAGASLLFKAHPRDPGYPVGAYDALFRKSGVPITDVTHVDVGKAFAQAPRVVVTQFSSVAIEAGFFGVPSVWVLLPDAGAARLAQKKGYRTPPLFAAGACGLASSAGQVAGMLGQALHDTAWRADTMAHFDRYFAIGELATPVLIDRLLALTRV